MKKLICKLLLIINFIIIAVASNVLAVPSDQMTVGAALPGAGTAINQQGKADSLGVFQINIPTAYTPSNNFYCLGFYSGGHHSGKRNKINNSIGYFSAGFGEETRFSAAVAVNEKDVNDSLIFNAQIELTDEKIEMPGFAIGIQDISNEIDFSLYGIATYKIETQEIPIYLTAGYGGGRFMDRLFGGISVPVLDNANVSIEYDGFQFNGGIGFKPDGRFGKFTILAGYNDKSGIMLGGSINF